MKINVKKMQRTGRHAQFTNHALAFIEFQFPVGRCHGKRPRETNRHAIAAIDTLIFLETDSLFQRLHFHIMVGKVRHTGFNIGRGSLHLKQQTAPFTREYFSLQNIDTDIVIFDQMIAQWLIPAVGRKIQDKSFEAGAVLVPGVDFETSHFLIIQSNPLSVSFPFGSNPQSSPLRC